MAEELAPVLAGYAEFLQEIQDTIRTARVRAAVAVNRELVLLYWRIGREILTRQERQGWGTRVSGWPRISGPPFQRSAGSQLVTSST